MNEITIAGTHEELGCAYGEVVAERKLNTWWREPSARKLAFVKACEEAVAEHAPGYLDELRALAVANDADYYLVLSNMIATYFAEPACCNVVGVSGSQTARGRTIFVRNHDWLDADAHAVTCFRTAPRDGLRHIAFGFTDPGRYDGVNEAGLAVGSSSIAFYTGKVQPGLRMNVVTRWVLDTCPDVPSAVEYMRRIPHQEGIAYLLADASGLVARVEAAPEGVDVAMTDDGMLSTVNMFQSAAMAPYDRVPNPGNVIFEYRRRIEAWYDADRGAIDLGKTIAFASDHDAGICDHGKEWEESFGTIYSWVTELGTDELRVAHGRPCQTPYEPYPLIVPRGDA